jgi:hypothetical protein
MRYSSNRSYRDCLMEEVKRVISDLEEKPKDSKIKIFFKNLFNNIKSKIFKK